MQDDQGVGMTTLLEIVLYGLLNTKKEFKFDHTLYTIRHNFHAHIFAVLD